MARLADFTFSLANSELHRQLVTHFQNVRYCLQNEVMKSPGLDSESVPCCVVRVAEVPYDPVSCLHFWWQVLEARGTHMHTQHL